MTDVFDRLKSTLADRYAIERELGQGGMATVYLAQDLRHDREVALKVLRPDLAATLGPERFLREVRIAAKLQHPNILPVYDSGEAAGFLYYVMPYVEGESLRERISKHGELPLGDAARILRDVADALATAHAHGVVHRDIKPENVMLSGRHALVADFGVAKAVVEATGRQTLTTAGVALGTPTYMAPEQAAADPHTDHRADLYALGVTAYELVTGRPPFVGVTAQAVLAAHMTEVPTPVETLRPTAPPALGQLIMRCLAKKPADRPQSAEELLPVLEALATPSGGVTPAQTQPVVAVPVRGRVITLGAIAAGAVAVAVAVVASRFLGSRPLVITITDMAQVTSAPDVEFQPAISPDGQEVAYVAGPIGAPHLVIRRAANVPGGGSVRLTDTSLRSEWFPRWSSDGAFVRFSGCRANGCGWTETDKLGGATRPARRPQRRMSRLAWSPDGARIAFVVADTLFDIAVDDTVARRIAVHAVSHWELHSVAWSPDGGRIAYVNGNPQWLTSGNVARSSIWVVDTDGTEPQRVTTEDHLNVSPVWLDRRHILFVSNRDGPRGVYVVEVGPQGARGEPRLVPGAADPHSISYSISARKLAWAKFTLRQNIWSYPLGRSAPVSIRDGQPVTSGNQVIEAHDVSPDGKWLVYDNNLRGNMDLYKVPLGGGEVVPLTDSPGDEFSPRWSPDGREIAFYDFVTSPEGRQERVLVMPATGGTPSVLPSRADVAEYPSWSPDGLDIAFVSARTGRPETWLVSRDSMGGSWHEAVQLTDFGSFPFDWTPDGAGVLAHASGDGSQLIIVSRGNTISWRYDLTGFNGLTAHGRIGDTRYSRDGRMLYLAATHRDGREGIWAMPGAGGRARLVVAFDDPALVAALGGSISFGPDRLYLTVSEYESDIWVANLKY